MLQWLKLLYKEDNKPHPIPDYVQKDLLWWNNFLPLYNGVSIMIMEEWSNPDEIFSSDSSLLGCGGFWKGSYFHAEFPSAILNKQYSINILEMLSILICIKLWRKAFKGKRIKIFCDNMSVCCVINTGKTKCEFLQNCLRELAFLTAISECEVRAVHLDSQANRISDHLSRWSMAEFHKNQFFRLTSHYPLTEYIVTPDLFHFINNW